MEVFIHDICRVNKADGQDQSFMVQFGELWADRAGNFPTCVLPWMNPKHVTLGRWNRELDWLYLLDTGFNVWTWLAGNGANNLLGWLTKAWIPQRAIFNEVKMRELPCNYLGEGIQQTYKFGDVKIKLWWATFFPSDNVAWKLQKTLPSLGHWEMCYEGNSRILENLMLAVTVDWGWWLEWPPLK